MEIALIVGLSLLLGFSLMGGILLYSHYIYSKNRVFSPTKYSILSIVLSILMFSLIMGAGICFIFDIQQWHTSDAYDPAYIGLSFSCAGISLIYFIFFLIIPRATNKNKIAYNNILNIDYQTMLNNLMARIGDIQALKDEINKKHHKYYVQMLSYYESILIHLKDKKISIVDKQADIVTFNDAFTHKWSTHTNDLQLLLTYQFCDALVKIS